MTREAILQIDRHNSTPSDDRPLSVKEASKYLGVSPQTVYLWVERKQIPHLRVMGRSIRFLSSDLERFRTSFKQEGEWVDRLNMRVELFGERKQGSGGCTIENGTAPAGGSQLSPKTGMKRIRS